ncbi:hypothetical protein [Acinetobacter sp. YH12086]|uniref:hypothetical protein n=1 Tax=Acinetobacter sp. YH12086 TaxID=2601078 RepID=UPI0015D2F8A7|nr:hypothetical protein [Acinetobacter sp. YH12086]
MNHQAYDQKNKADFNDYTSTLEKALKEIENNKNLKASVAQLERMTGIHRNTISNREWPVKKLKEIKKEREKEKLREEQSCLQTEPLDKKLTQVQNEVIYWFSMYQEMKVFFENTKQQLKKAKESRDYYEKLYKSGQKSFITAEQEIERLKDLLEQNGISPDQFKN